MSDLTETAEFTNDGWIRFAKQNTSAGISPPLQTVIDNFNGSTLSNFWQHTVFQPVKYELKRKCLLLTSLDSFPMTFLGVKTYSGDYHASVSVDFQHSTAGVGIGVIGDERNAVVDVYEKGMMHVIVLKDGKETIVATDTAGRLGKRAVIAMEGHNGNQVSFTYTNTMQSWRRVNPQSVDGSFLPPWDRAVRAGVVVRGRGVGAFKSFGMSDVKPAK